MKKVPSFESYGDIKAKNFVGNGSQITGVSLPDDWVSKVMTVNTPKFVYHNGSVYKFVLDLSTQPNNEYTTTDIQAEIDGEELIWENKISTYPAPDFVIFSPLFVLPNSTTNVTFTGSFLKDGTKVLIENATINYYVYISETEFIANVTFSSTLEELVIKVTNGVEIILDNTLSVTNGEALLAGHEDSPWINADDGLVQSVGSIENVTGTYLFASFSNGFTGDFELKFQVGKVYHTASWIYMKLQLDQLKTSFGNGAVWVNSPAFYPNSNDYPARVQNEEYVYLRRVGTQLTYGIGDKIISTETFNNTNTLYPSFLLYNEIEIKNVTLNIL